MSGVVLRRWRSLQRTDESCGKKGEAHPVKTDSALATVSEGRPEEDGSGAEGRRILTNRGAAQSSAVAHTYRLSRQSSRLEREATVSRQSSLLEREATVSRQSSLLEREVTVSRQSSLLV